MGLIETRQELKTEITDIKNRLDEITEYDDALTDDPIEIEFLNDYNLDAAAMKNLYEELLFKKVKVLKRISMEGVI